MAFAKYVLLVMYEITFGWNKNFRKAYTLFKCLAPVGIATTSTQSAPPSFGKINLIFEFGLLILILLMSDEAAIAIQAFPDAKSSNP